MHFPILAYTFYLFSLYPICAVMFSDSRFHRVWSLSLSLLWLLTARLLDQPFSVSSVPLALFTLLVSIVCIILSPAQLLLFNTNRIGVKKKALEIYTPRDKETVSIDIVAVHGLAANPQTTWLSRLPSNKIAAASYQAMWLRDFLPNEEDINARVIIFNHNTSWNAYALDKSLHDHGDDLLQALRTVRQGDEKHRPIVFVGHSFGGLIIKQALVNAGADSADDFCRSTRQKARGFIFLGTPHKGARIALLGQLLSLLGFWRGSSTVLLESTKPESATNQNLHYDFMGYLRSDGPGTDNTLCVFEAVKQQFWRMPIIHVVDKDSAIIDGSHKIGFETDHGNMQRFPNQEDEDYKNILVWIRRWMEHAKEEAHEDHTAKAQENTLEQPRVGIKSPCRLSRPALPKSRQGLLIPTLEQECLKSLHFPNMDQREYLVESAATKTCTWLLNHEKYAAWLAQPHTLLWIVGKPGAGKSTLIRYALQNSSFNNDVVASFFFYGRGSDLQKSACGMFRSLSHQLSDQAPELLSKFNMIFKKKCETKRYSEPECEWHETELRDLLQDWILSASRDRSIRIYLDALDEAGQEVAVKLVTFFEELIERLHPTSPGVRICFSCRHYPVLAPKNALKVCVEDENHHDIETYVRQKLTRYQLSDRKEGRKLEQEIIEKSCCIFQWVVLIIPIIIRSDKDGASVAKIRQKIKEMPGKLSDLYQHTLSNIREPKRAVQLMQWICFAMEPLSLEDLRYAMVVDITKDFKSLKECQSSVDFADTDEQMRKTVNSLSGGLAETVEYGGRQTVRFIHQSVNDYLIERGLQTLDSSFFSDVNDYLSRSKLPILERSLSDAVVGLAHFRISRSCVKYINLEGVLEEIKETSRLLDRWHWLTEELKRRLPFLRYCANWASHAEIVEKERLPQADLISLFCWPCEDLIHSWSAIFFHYLAPQDGPNGTLLLFASRHGLSSVIEAMIESGVSVNFETRDERGCTPLIMAAIRGHEAVVQLLIERDDVDVNSKDHTQGTPISCAAKYRHEAVVRLLIEREDIDINASDSMGWTPMIHAAEYGHEAVVRLLIERDDVHMNAKDVWGWTPLTMAAFKGHEAIVRLLFKRDVEIDPRDNDGRTPVSHAACLGHVAVVRLLIEQGADVDLRDNHGRTPLSRAACLGHVAVVRLLIEQDVDVNSRDNKGRTPLALAAIIGREAIVRLLVERDVEIDSRDNEGRTPLSNAAICGREALVRLLIEQENIDIESKDNSGRTAFDHAVKRVSQDCGEKSMVKLLRHEILRRKNLLKG